jgi:hypothetical protein
MATRRGVFVFESNLHRKIAAPCVIANHGDASRSQPSAGPGPMRAGAVYPEQWTGSSGIYGFMDLLWVYYGFIMDFRIPGFRVALMGFVFIGGVLWHFRIPRAAGGFLRLLFSGKYT